MWNFASFWKISQMVYFKNRFAKNRTGIPYSISHWNIKFYVINQCKWFIFWIPNNLYLDFNFQVDEIHILRETSDDLFLACQF